MAGFPTTPILDNFNRANEGPPMTGWSDLAGGLKIVSNACVGNASGGAVNASYWNATKFGPDIEVYATLTAKSIVTDDTIRLLARIDNTLLNAYVIEYDEQTAGTDGLILGRIDGGVQTDLVSIPQEMSVGDSFGLSVIGSMLTAWYKPSGGAWRPIGTAVDTTYTVSNYIGAFINFTAVSPSFDDFGGGTFSPSMNTKTGWWGDL